MAYLKYPDIIIPDFISDSKQNAAAVWYIKFTEAALLHNFCFKCLDADMSNVNSYEL